MNTRKLIPRILTLPFMIVFLIIPMLSIYFKWLKNWFLYGGEIIAYSEKHEYKKIADLYYMLKDERL